MTSPDSIKHTPGPWEVGNEDDRHEAGGVYCDNALGSRVAIVFGKHQDFSAFSRDEERANARLIAAAPDLLEALKDLAGESRETFAHWPDLKAQTEAAIAKAEGRIHQPATAKEGQ